MEIYNCFETNKHWNKRTSELGKYGVAHTIQSKLANHQCKCAPKMLAKA